MAAGQVKVECILADVQDHAVTGQPENDPGGAGSARSGEERTAERFASASGSACCGR